MQLDMRRTKLSKLLRKAADELSRGEHPAWDNLLRSVGAFRSRKLHAIPSEVLVHILTFAFPHPFTFHQPALSLGRIFLRKDPVAMQSWVGRDAFAIKERLFRMLRSVHAIVPRLPLNTNAHIFVVSGSDRIAVAFWDTSQIHGPCKFVDDADIGTLVRVIRENGVYCFEIHRSWLAKGYTEGNLPCGSVFRLGLTMNKRFIPIHLVESASTVQIRVD